MLLHACHLCAYVICKSPESVFLTGEEVVTKESFISVCWRLIPYWLNNWEQQWGAECSSMMFELPHFAIELLVVLPCVQVTLMSPQQPTAWPAGGLAWL